MNPQYPQYQPYGQPPIPQPPPSQPLYPQPQFYPQQTYPQPPSQPLYPQPPSQPLYPQPPSQPYFQQPPSQPLYPQPPNQPLYSQPPSQPYFQQPPSQPLYPTVQSPYYVFNPTMFTDANNPWTASMWMQNYNVQPQQSSVQMPSEIFKFESIEQFQELRHHATIESALSQLNELATDLSQYDPHNFFPEPACCFIICNSYTKPLYKLGVGPINDAITVAANHKFMGYKVYFLHNPPHSIFLKFLKEFLQKVNQYLTVYYTGHGAQVKDNSGDEADGYDEVVVFDDGVVVDDKLADYLKKYHNNYAHTVLLSDCCHSGTVWDIPENVQQAELEFPPNILSVSASKDNQTAKQTRIESNSQGIFTFNFFTVIRNNPYLTIGEVKNMIDPQLKKFNQQIEMYPTRMDMLSKPVFPLMIKN